MPPRRAPSPIRDEQHPPDTVEGQVFEQGMLTLSTKAVGIKPSSSSHLLPPRSNLSQNPIQNSSYQRWHTQFQPPSYQSSMQRFGSMDDISRARINPSLPNTSTSPHSRRAVSWGGSVDERFSGPSGGGGGSGVKEMQWSAFTTEYIFTKFDGNLVDPVVKWDNVVNGEFNLLENLSHVESVGGYSHQFQEGQTYRTSGGESTNGQDYYSIEYWESLYPGWKYDAHTAQWYQVDGSFNATSNVQMADNASSAYDWTLSNVKTEVAYLQHTAQSLVAEKGDSMYPNWQTSHTNEILSKWSQTSQGNNVYPSYFYFDPQYPGWYYDMNAQEWRSLNAYNSQIINQSSPGPVITVTTALVPKFTTPMKTNDNSFTTPRSQGRSALYNMPRTPYYRAPSTLSQKGVASPFSSENEGLVGSSKIAAKRRSSALDDIGSGGPMRRIRQKASLLSQQSKGKQIAEESREISKRNQNYGSVPTKSSQIALKIFEQLDRMSPKEKVSVSKLAGTAEKIVSPKLLSSSQDNLKSAGQNRVSFPESHEPTFSSRETVNNNGSLNITGHSNATSLVDGNLTKPIKDGATTKQSFLMSVHEDGSELVDGPHSNGNLSISPAENKRPGKSVLTSDFSTAANEEIIQTPSPSEAVQTPRHEVDTISGAKRNNTPAAKRNNAQYADYGASSYCLQQLPSEGSTKAIASEVQTLLVSGRKMEAPRHAQEGQLWGLALILATQLGDQFYVDTVRNMALRQLVAGSPMRTLCLLITGQPAYVFLADPMAGDPAISAANVYQQPAQAQVGTNAMIDLFIKTVMFEVKTGQMPASVSFRDPFLVSFAALYGHKPLDLARYLPHSQGRVIIWTDILNHGTLVEHVYTYKNTCFYVFRSILSESDANYVDGRREWRPPWHPQWCYIETAPSAIVRLEWRPPWQTHSVLEDKNILTRRVLIRANPMKWQPTSKVGPTNRQPSPFIMKIRFRPLFVCYWISLYVSYLLHGYHG